MELQPTALPADSRQAVWTRVRSCELGVREQDRLTPQVGMAAATELQAVWAFAQEAKTMVRMETRADDFMIEINKSGKLKLIWYFE